MVSARYQHVRHIDGGTAATVSYEVLDHGALRSLLVLQQEARGFTQELANCDGTNARKITNAGSQVRIKPHRKHVVQASGFGRALCQLHVFVTQLIGDLSPLSFG